MKLGDRVATVATPIARALKLPCVDPVTKELKPESGCAKRRDWLNSWNKGDKMQFTIQIVVEAESVKQALEKINDGTVLSVNPRAQALPAPGRLSALQAHTERQGQKA